MNHIETSQKGRKNGDVQQQKYTQQLTGNNAMDLQMKFL